MPLNGSWSLPSKDIFEARGGSPKQNYHGKETMADQGTAHGRSNQDLG